MVTQEQIRALPRKYSIGKRPLSRILGWGELTYTRLLEGAAPNDEHAAELERALNDPLAYLVLLDRAFEAGLVAESSYRRSRAAAERHLADSAAADSTFMMHAVARRLCEHAQGDVTPRALNILTYYVQGTSLVLLDEPLFDELPLATDDGPSYPALTDWFDAAHIGEVAKGSTATDPERAGSLSKKQAKLVDGVFERYGIYSGTKLADMARSEAPWRKARKRAEGSGGGEAVITAKSMVKFFRKTVE